MFRLLSVDDVPGLVISNFQFLIPTSQSAISSVVEHLLHTQGVVGSIPTSRISNRSIVRADETLTTFIIDANDSTMSPTAVLGVARWR
jgi:hypothetical protein